MQKLTQIIAFMLIIMLCGCASHQNPVENQQPQWLHEMIAQFEREPVANPPLSVTQYTYNGQIVYYAPSHCCDIPGMLYNAAGQEICQPDGGLNGQGDGRCPDFFAARTDERLIWKDSRTQ